MLPTIALVNSVEMIRDGGSLAASFQGANGAEYWLFFQLRQQDLPSGQIERLGYEKPIVIERQSGIQSEVTWQHAVTLISQIRPLLCATSDEEWLEAMESVAQQEGALPSKVERFFGPAI
jgi:hypothetical protein